MNDGTRNITDDCIGKKVTIQHSIKLMLVRLEESSAFVAYTLDGETFELKLPKCILEVDDRDPTSSWLA